MTHATGQFLFFVCLFVYACVRILTLNPTFTVHINVQKVKNKYTPRSIQRLSGSILPTKAAVISLSRSWTLRQNNNIRSIQA